jgi:hypothetical protein
MYIIALIMLLSSRTCKWQTEMWNCYNFLTLCE